VAFFFLVHLTYACINYDMIVLNSFNAAASMMSLMIAAGWQDKCVLLITQQQDCRSACLACAMCPATADTVYVLHAVPGCPQMRDSTLPQLPGELVTQMLRHVDQCQRLTSCNLVCKAWQAAAVAASSDVRVASNSRHFSALSLGSFRQWLRKHAAAVAQLEVDSTCQSHKNTMLRNIPHDPQVLQLPAAQLQQLQKLAVIRCQLAIQADASSSQQLQLPEARSAHASNSGGQHALSSLTSLTSLVLEDVYNTT
jgi:hypothetical protein